MTVQRVGVMLAVVGLTILAAGTAWTEEKKEAAPNDIRIQMGAGNEPAVRMWINGKEVRPGDTLPGGIVGQLHVESIADPGGAAKPKPKPSGKGEAKTDANAKAKVSAKSHTRVEVQADPQGGQPTIRMWVDGQEVQPQAGKGDADARVRMWVKGKEVDQDGARVKVEAQPAAAEAEKAAAEGPRGGLGVRIAPLTDDLARAVGVKAGVAVIGAMPGSPAHRAGLREGDVITHVDGRPVTAPQALVDAVAAHRPGDQLRLRWQRPNAQLDTTIRLGNRDALMEAAQGRAPAGREAHRQAPPDAHRETPHDEPARQGGGFLGVMAAPLNDDMREIAGTDSGVLINSLTDDSPAAKAGLKPGDVIVRMGETKITSVEELVETLGTYRPGQRVPVIYYRMGKRRDTQVALGGRPGDKPDAPEAKKKGLPLFDLPEGLLGDTPDIGKYLEGLRPQMEDWIKKFQEQQPGQPGPWQRRQAPQAKPKMAPEADRDSDDLGKDIDRVIEKLERIEERLDRIEKRLDRTQR